MSRTVPIAVLAACGLVTLVKASNRLSLYKRLLPRVASRVKTQVHLINQS